MILFQHSLHFIVKRRTIHIRCDGLHWLGYSVEQSSPYKGENGTTLFLKWKYGPPIDFYGDDVVKYCPSSNDMENVAGSGAEVSNKLLC